MSQHGKGGRNPKGSITCRGALQWQARVRIKGVAHVETFKTAEKAQGWLDGLLKVRAQPERLQRAIEARSMTLANALRQRLKLKQSKTQVQQTKAVSRLIKNYPSLCERRLYDIDEIDIQDFIKVRCGEGVANSTVNRDLALISNAFNLARSKMGCTGLINPVGPTTRLQEPRGRTRRLEADEEAALMRQAAIYEVDSSIRIGAIIQFAADTCMRCGEVTGMDWQRVDLNRGTIFIPETKNGESRTVPCSMVTRAILRNLGPQSSGAVWGAHEAVRSAWRRVKVAAVKEALIAAASGVPGAADLAERLRTLRFHDLRHEGTSRLIERTGWENAKIKAVTGHKTDAMLARYTHLRAADLASELAALEGAPQLRVAGRAPVGDEAVEPPVSAQQRAQWRAVSSSANLMTMLVECKPIRSIAADFGISDAAVHKAIARLGVQKKRPGFWLVNRAMAA